MEALQRLLGKNNLLLSPSGAAAQAGVDFTTATQRFQSAAVSLTSLLGGEEVKGGSLEAMLPECLAKRCQTILSCSRLHTWCAWNRVVGEAQAHGLDPLAEALAKRTLTGEHAKEVFAVNYCRWWLNATVDADPLLQRFVSVEHEQIIDDFRCLDQKLATLARDCIRARLRNDTPEIADVRKSSEWGILRREMEKKRRHLPLRQLMEQLPTALPSLTPCLLMSPLSIAQYLPPGRTSFDLVVFDEASQIPVWDAIGAMARGQQVVVVGDPKQLPPTNFFNRAENEDADDAVEIGGDMESILDECLGAGLPRQRLNWHYRSRHESLIAFSNQRYYHGGLVTFPSPVTDDRAVSLHLVEGGIYDRGGKCTNRVEARAVVTDIVQHISDPAFVESGKSIGVVTFNSPQQQLIENLLDEERRRNPSLDRFFSDDLTEPVFVKNLENVQGDERDLMYFSITYGPDQTGQISMNFNPLNREGGERRLNVAVTRAKQTLKIFTSLLPEQLDLSRTKSKGVADLKLFLEYARRGAKALAEEVTAPRGDFDSPFEELVAKALSRRGWTVHPQVGVSVFRVDLGVVDPNRPGRYLAGVECDGATYHRAATARDRDMLREQVLRGLGWEIVRTWSTDWWHDAETAANKLDAKLKMFLECSQMKTAKTEMEQAHQEAGSDLGKRQDKTNLVSPPVVESMGTSIDAVFPDQPVASAVQLPSPRVYADRSDLTQPPGASTEPGAATRDLLADGQEVALAAAIREIVREEGPIRADVLARRIAKACGLFKAGSRIREKVLLVAQMTFESAREDGGLFIWPTGSTPGHWDRFRAEMNGALRPADEICLAELSALAREVASTIDANEDPVAAMARNMGLLRLRAVTRTRLEQAWEMSQQGNKGRDV